MYSYSLDADGSIWIIVDETGNEVEALPVDSYTEEAVQSKVDYYNKEGFGEEGDVESLDADVVPESSNRYKPIFGEELNEEKVFKQSAPMIASQLTKNADADEALEKIDTYIKKENENLSDAAKYRLKRAKNIIKRR